MKVIAQDQDIKEIESNVVELCDTLDIDLSDSDGDGGGDGNDKDKKKGASSKTW